MTAALAKSDTAVMLDANRRPEEATAQSGVRARARSLCSACRQVFGMPDYERYLAHAAERHPGAPVLTRSDFFVKAIERKYGKGGARCC
jgi:uncharacterized short protein YbdD (DUF466 family)